MINDINAFENCAKENGVRYWSSIEYKNILGYETDASFNNVINKAMGVCVNLNIQIPDAFSPHTFDVDGVTKSGYKLSRFACFLIAMMADEKKPAVAEARVYLAAFASVCVDEQESLDDMVRLEIRNELKQAEKSLATVAIGAGLPRSMIALFKDEGFRGMYNMRSKALKSKRGLDMKGILYDYMGQTELAGNFFRVTQTVERIKNNKIQGQQKLNQTAYKVGKEVRNMMTQDGGSKPELLPQEDHIKESTKRLKGANREMKKIDKPKKKK